MVMTGVVCVALSVLALRLAQVQVIQGGRLQHLAQRQQMEVIAIEPHRGLILDRRGRPLAINVEATSIYAVPSAIADRQAFAARVAPLLRQRVDEVRRRLATGRHFAWLARKVSPQMVARVRTLGMADQIGFLTEDKRAYPNGPLAAQVIGFAGIDNQGLTGVELSYEHVLHGTIGRAIAARDGLGRVMVETQQVLGTPQDGQDIQLTIDQVIQHIAERELSAAGGRRHGWQGVGVMVKNPCNVGVEQVGTRLGKAQFFHYIRAFGFGQPIGIDRPGESAGIVPPPSAWRGPGLQTISFGQGVSTTAIQMLTAATALVNDGTMLRPYIVRAVRDHQGRLTEAVGRQVVGRVIRPETAAAVLQMMVGTTTSGTGTQARIDGYTVAGKTATAQKPARRGGYDPDRYVASFLGIVPIPNPRLAVLVALDEPRGAYSGGERAAPLFRQLASQVLGYLGVPPLVRSAPPC